MSYIKIKGSIPHDLTAVIVILFVLLSYFWKSPGASSQAFTENALRGLLYLNAQSTLNLCHSDHVLFYSFVFAQPYSGMYFAWAASFFFSENKMG